MIMSDSNQSTLSQKQIDSVINLYSNGQFDEALNSLKALIKLHPEVSIKIKLNIARSSEEAKEQNKSGKPLISTETTGGDIRSERAQKDAKRFIKKEDAKTPNDDDIKEALVKTEIKDHKNIDSI